FATTSGDIDFGGFGPGSRYHMPFPITQQNSYTYLRAVLGANPHQMSATGQDVTTFHNFPFNGVVATFGDANAAGTSDTYTAKIWWGDGHSSTGNVVANGDGTFSVLGTHDYRSDGSYAVTVRITDANGFTTYANSTATVNTVPNDLSGHGQA